MECCPWVHFQLMCLCEIVRSSKELPSNFFWPLLNRGKKKLFLKNIYYPIFSLSYYCIVHPYDSAGKLSFGLLEKNINE